MISLYPFKLNHGFILLPVVLTLTVLAAVAFMLSRQSAINAGGVVREHEPDTLRYIAESGVNHTQWLANQQNCTNYSDLVDVPLGSHSYSSSITPNNNSPVNLKVVATHSNNTSSTLNRNNVIIYQFPSQTVTIQPGATDGKDTYIWAFHKGTNYGNDDETWVATGNNNVALALFQFDLSRIPEKAKIVSANLSIYHQDGYDANVPVTAHRITNAWNEAYVTWNNRDNGTVWDNAGGDFDSFSIAITKVGPTDSIRYQWDITSLLQAWIQKIYENNGIALRTIEPGIYGERFDTSDHSDPTHHPKLTITYACECGVVCTDPAANKLLLVVVNQSGLTTQESDKKALFESWGYTVTLIDVDDAQATFDTAVTNNDVVFITEDINSTKLNIKLTSATIGVVYEEDNLSDEFGMASTITWDSGDSLIINDNSHYITQPFSIGKINIMTVANSLSYVSGTLSEDIQNLGSIPGGPALVTLEAGANTYTAGTTAGRRVQLPWGGNSFDVNTLTSDGLIILQRSLEWGTAVPSSGSPPPEPPSESCKGIYRDEFNTVSFTGNDGTLTWAGDWQEVGETDSASSGDISIVNDSSNYQLQLQDNDNGGEGVAREANLSGAGSVTLSLQYRRNGLDSSSDYVTVEISSTGTTGPWTERGRFDGSANDVSYQSWSYSLTATEISANTAIRLLTSSTMGRKDQIYFDNIQLVCEP